MQLNPNNFYHNGNFSGKLTAKLRTTSSKGATHTTALQALLTAIKDVATADGTIANVVTYANGLLTEFATPATLNKVVEKF